MRQAKYRCVLSKKHVCGLLLAALVACIIGTGAQASSDKGSVTNLPIPRFVSLKASEGNVRRGPSLSHRIDWIFTTRDMPLEVTGEFGHWRRVRDRDGAGGWVHYSLISGMRTVIVEYEIFTPEDEDSWLPMLMKPDPRAPINARVQAGVVARLGACSGDWCKITANRHRGWVPRDALWGLLPGEERK